MPRGCHMTADTAQPRKRSNVTRPFPVLWVGSGNETSYIYVRMPAELLRLRRLIAALTSSTRVENAFLVYQGRYLYFRDGVPDFLEGGIVRESRCTEIREMVSP